jgi:3-hydroxyisobutyrate dehydrogenase-like beta-hydroxyacid dehydrogenase
LIKTLIIGILAVKTNVGFIGLGKMGKWMASNIAKHGFNIKVYDTDPTIVDFLAGQGAIPARSLSDVTIGSDVLILSLPDDHVANDVIFGEIGIAKKAQRGTILIDCGTSGYLWTQATNDILSKSEIYMLDAPVTGLEKRAKRAELTFMVGGAKEQFEKVQPVLKAMGNTIKHMGESGSGQLAKMINNIMYNINIAALAEILPFAVKLGLSPEKLADVINSGSGCSFASEFFIPKMLENRFKDSYSMGNAYKDMQHMEEASSQLNVCLPLFQSALDTYRKALDCGLEDEDKGSMIKVFEKKMGVLFRKNIS